MLVHKGMDWESGRASVNLPIIDSPSIAVVASYFLF